MEFQKDCLEMLLNLNADLQNECDFYNTSLVSSKYDVYSSMLGCIGNVCIHSIQMKKNREKICKN